MIQCNICGDMAWVVVLHKLAWDIKYEIFFNVAFHVRLDLYSKCDNILLFCNVFPLWFCIGVDKKISSTKHDISQKRLCLTKHSSTTTEYPLARVKCHLTRSPINQTKLQYNFSDCYEWREISITTQRLPFLIVSLNGTEGHCRHALLYSYELSDAIWRQKTVPTLVQVMACCLTTPSYYLNQCWLIISKV